MCNLRIDHSQSTRRGIVPDRSKDRPTASFGRRIAKDIPPIARRANQFFLSSPNFPLALMGQISGISPRVSPDKRGGSRSSRNARWDAVDADVATDERDLSGRRNRVGLTPRRWCQVRGKQNFSRMRVARKPGHPGERGISRNPSRRESRIASAEPVCSCAFCP